MTSYKNNNPLVDEMFDEDIDYTIVFDRGLGILTAPELKTSHTGHGVNGALGAMAQILVQMSESDFDFDIDWLKSQLSTVTAEDLGFTGDLQSVREDISRLTAVIDQADGENSSTVRDAVKAREDLRRSETDLMLGIEAVEGIFLFNKRSLEFLDLVEKIIADTKSGNLNLEAEVDQELLEVAGVPDNEPRRTVGALVYYYVAHLASDPISDEPDHGGPGTVLATLLPKAYLLVDSTP